MLHACNRHAGAVLLALPTPTRAVDVAFAATSAGDFTNQLRYYITRLIDARRSRVVEACDTMNASSPHAFL
jgi:hypothetical protein